MWMNFQLFIVVSQHHSSSDDLGQQLDVGYVHIYIHMHFKVNIAAAVLLMWHANFLLNVPFKIFAAKYWNRIVCYVFYFAIHVYYIFRENVL